MHLQVIIVGGSLAGLMHAIVLKKLGHDVHVLEKSSADVLRSQAGGLNAGPDVQKFIAEYIQPQEPYTKTSNAVEVINLQGAVINQIPSKDPYQLTTWSLLYRMFKTHFLADGGSVVKYEMEKHVKGIKEDGDKVLVTYSNADGTSHELSADLVIAADGAHSIIRRTVIPDATPPEYAGFVTWRGALSVSEVSAASRAVLEGRMLIFRTDDGGYTVSYHVPSDSGSTAPEDSQFIWIWYEKLAQDSPAFVRAFTDTASVRHFTTIPRGKVSPTIWSDRQSAATSLSAPFAELHAKTNAPFISAIRDSAPLHGIVFNGKVVLVGDAFCLFRPHTGSSTNQAARQALELAEWMRGERTMEAWEESAVAYARMTGAISKAFGEYCFTGKVPEMLGAAVKPEAEG